MIDRSQPEAIADRLHSAALRLLRRLRREDASSGLTAAQLSALSVIVFAGPVTLGDLAAAEQVTPATMSRLVDLLARRGLAKREADEADGRVVRVRATPSGTATLMEGRARRVHALARRLKALDSAELAVLGRGTEVLEALLRTEE
jgi:DNA-binding MarR family transcriptional regulator